jgi:hypothetical protein
MSWTTSRVATGTELGADCVAELLATVSLPNRCPLFLRQHPSWFEAPLTLLQPVSWHRHYGRTSASTRRSIRERKRWHRWGGRCSSRWRKLPRSMSKPRAISSNSSAMPSSCASKPVYNTMPSADEALALAGAVGLGKGIRESYRSSPAGGIAGRGAGGARRTQC